MNPERERSRRQREEREGQREIIPPVRSSRSVLLQDMEGESIEEAASSCNIGGCEKSSVEHEMAENSAPPITIMERKKGFQDLSSLFPIMQDALSRNLDMEGRIDQAERERMKQINSGTKRRNYKEVREV